MLVLFQAAVRIIANYPVFRAALQMPLSRNLLLPSVGSNAAFSIIEIAVKYPCHKPFNNMPKPVFNY